MENKNYRSKDIAFTFTVKEISPIKQSFPGFVVPIVFDPLYLTTVVQSLVTGQTWN